MNHHLSSVFTSVTMLNIPVTLCRGTVMSPTSRAAPRRERARAATIDEIKQTALKIMHTRGSVDVTFTEIARAMDMTPPALYRYFADRDQLLTALIADAYNALGAAITEAYTVANPPLLENRWFAVTQAYRQWARREPQQFSLIFGLPMPGFAAPQEGPTTEAARRALAQLSRLFVDAIEQGRLGEPLIKKIHPAVAACAATKQTHTGLEIPPLSFQAMLHAWAIIHGFITLEAYGHFEWMGEQARDELFRGQLRLAAIASGMPVPTP
jgi:AcrR family transcriptional regulator